MRIGPNPKVEEVAEKIMEKLWWSDRGYATLLAALAIRLKTELARYKPYIPISPTWYGRVWVLRVFVPPEEADYVKQRIEEIARGALMGVVGYDVFEHDGPRGLREFELYVEEPPRPRIRGINY